MNTLQERRKLLTDALRSGEYRQGRNRLRRHRDGEPDGFCCLGVACDVYLKNGGEGHWSEPEATKGWWFVTPKSTETGPDQDYITLPGMVADWYGFREPGGNFDTRFRSGWHSLTNLNDAGTSFSAIADLIDAAPKGLFKEDAA